MVQNAFEATQRLVPERELIALSDRDTFQAALQTQPEPNEALGKLLRSA